MADATDIYGKAFRNGSAVLLARVVGGDGVPLVRSDIASAEYSLHELDRDDPDSREPVTGHTAVSLAVEDVVFDGLQTDITWTMDSMGYNFRHVLAVDTNDAFAIAGRDYLIEFRLTPVTGQVIIVRFRIYVI